MADEKLSSELTDKGWQLAHAEPKMTANDSPTGAAVPGHYIALKRDPSISGEGPVEMQATSVEQLETMIGDWERSRPVDPSKAAAPSEEALMNSAKATLHQAVTSGARPSLDVDLTPAAEKPEPKGVNIAVVPQIEETELDDEAAAGLAALPPAASKTEGVGDQAPGEGAGKSGKTGSGSK